MTYERWMEAVEAAMLDIAEIGPDEIDDFGYASAYEDDLSPRETAKVALVEAGWPR